MAKPDIRNQSLDDLMRYVKMRNEPAFRASQIFEWIYQKQARDIDGIKNISKPLKDSLKGDFGIYHQKILQRQKSSDGTTKVLFELHGGEKVETVLIPTQRRATVCVSTQAGCKFGCRFCASGIGGWKRNLDCSEILDQILYMKAEARGKPLSHIVFMGVGEPLDNYDNLIKAIRIINSPKGIRIAARRITVSTCGLIPKIEMLSKEGMQIELAVSLHGSSDTSRNVLMPVNKKYPIRDLIEACRKYNKATKRQITFEYILIKDVTCTEKAASELGQLLSGLLCKINLIPYNPVDEFDHNPPSRNKMIDFKRQLARQGIHSTIRMPRGRDVSAACGQLRHSA